MSQLGQRLAPAEVKADLSDEVLDLLLATFQDLRSGKTRDGVPVPRPDAVMSTAEAVNVAHAASLDAVYFREGRVTGAHVARQLTGVVLKDNVEDVRKLGAGIDPHMPTIMLSPATTDHSLAQRWLGEIGHGLDGIVAKRLDLPYRPGDRAMRKFKLWKTVDCVVAGVYYKRPGEQIDSLLLGLYDDAGLLHYVGRVRVGRAAPEMERRIRPLIGGKLGFTGRAPGGPSRWTGRERNPIPVKPKQVVEVSADHITDNHMRHGARLLRWRTDKPPKRCTMDQIAPQLA